MTPRATLGSALALSLAGSAMAQDRMPPLAPDQQTPAQKAASEEFLKTRKTPVFGPFTPLLRSPELMTTANHMGDFLRYRSALPPKLSELAILIVAREWDQRIEWEIHEPIAVKAGVSEATVKAIMTGKRPKGASADETLVYDFLTELHRTRQVKDATYQKALKSFGDQGVIDLTGIAGYYTLLAMTMNVARTAPTTDAPPVFPPLKR